MKDELTCLLIESVNINPHLMPHEKIELISMTLKYCQQVKIGKTITDAIEKTEKARKAINKPRKKSEHSAAFIAKRSPHAEKMLTQMKADQDGRY